MFLRRLGMVVLSVAAAACGQLERPAPSDHVIVPGDYRLARPTPGHQAHLRAGFDADGGRTADDQVFCRDCHTISDAGFSHPTAAACSRCHEPQQKQHHPLDGGTEFTCLTCHPFMAKTVPARFERWPCFGCHQEEQAGHPAIGVHRANCEACHRPHQSPFTQAANCSECHEVRISHGARAQTLADRCMDCHPHHSEASVASKQCISCHSKDSVKAPAHVSTQALFNPGHPGCGSCHEAHRFEKNAVKPCESCHRGQPVLAEWEHACTDCHRPHEPKSRAIECTDSCHKNAGVEHPKSKDGETCKGCHPVHAPGDQLAKSCVTCHEKPAFTAKVVHGAPITCDDCHDPHDDKPASPRECKSCHSYRYAEVALMTAKKPGTSVGGHSVCVDCHQQLPHGPPTAPKNCTACHKNAPLSEKHSECAKCHDSHSGMLVKSCADCHRIKDLPALHSVEEHQVCDKCHSVHPATAARHKPQRGPVACKSCHTLLTKKDHPTPPKECSGCHLFEPVKP